MDEFLKIGEEKQKQTKVQRRKRKNPIEKDRVSRLKKTFLPYWARETEIEARKENNLDLSR